MNTRHMEISIDLFDLINRCFDGWEKDGDPTVILLKSLYILASSEGFPVRQEWFDSLSASMRQTAVALFSPLRNGSRFGVSDILKPLEIWLVSLGGIPLHKAVTD